MFIADSLLKWDCRSNIPGTDVWVLAEPMPGPRSWRLRDAWEVFRGRAHAIRFLKTKKDLQPRPTTRREANADLLAGGDVE